MSFTIGCSGRSSGDVSALPKGRRLVNAYVFPSESKAAPPGYPGGSSKMASAVATAAAPSYQEVLEEDEGGAMAMGSPMIIPPHANTAGTAQVAANDSDVTFAAQKLNDDVRAVESSPSSGVVGAYVTKSPAYIGSAFDFSITHPVTGFVHPFDYTRAQIHKIQVEVTNPLKKSIGIQFHNPRFATAQHVFPSPTGEAVLHHMVIGPGKTVTSEVYKDPHAGQMIGAADLFDPALHEKVDEDTTHIKISSPIIDKMYEMGDVSEEDMQHYRTVRASGVKGQYVLPSFNHDAYNDMRVHFGERFAAFQDRTINLAENHGYTVMYADGTRFTAADRDAIIPVECTFVVGSQPTAPAPK